MKLVIEINEEDYEIMKHNIAVNNPLCPLGEKEMVTIVANGIPLPKSHGRIIDSDVLKSLCRKYKISNGAFDRTPIIAIKKR